MSGLGEEEISSKWPLHWMVWNNDHKALNRLLEQKVYDQEAKDPRGRTPLHLAVTLGYRDCMEVLMYHGANTLSTNRHQWSVSHEAICTGNPDIVNMTLMVKDRQQADQQAKEIPLMLERLQSAPDFYAEMRWEFTSWIPFLSRVCPSDTYKIWKRGAQVRVDTSLIGFQNMQWLRGNQSFIFHVTNQGVKFIEVDHDKKLVWEHPIKLFSSPSTSDPESYMAQHALGVVRRISSPVISTAFDMDSIEFQRQKAGIWGFRSDRNEVVDGHNAKVFTASGLNLVTRTRVDHLPENEREKYKDSGTGIFQTFLGMDDELPPETTNIPVGGGGGGGGGKGGVPGANMLMGSSSVTEKNKSSQLTASEYFTPPTNPKEYDAIGHPVEVYSKVQSLKATVWLAEEHPLSLQDQIMPVIELMAVNNAHFAKLKDFITLQMPAGFPVKFEIPLFHVISARVTFGNMNGMSQPASYVSLEDETIINSTQPITQEPLATPTTHPQYPALKRRHTNSSSRDDDGSSTATPSTVEQHTSTPPPTVPVRNVTRRNKCLISEEAFKVPKEYRSPNEWRDGNLADEEEELLQMAIRQSLLEYNTSSTTDSSGDQQRDDELSLSEALRDDTIMSGTNTSNQFTSPLAPYAVVPPPSSTSAQDDDFILALALSQVQAEEDERRRKEEDEELERILKLSLEDK